jgi:hypothetical protein
MLAGMVVELEAQLRREARTVMVHDAMCLEAVLDADATPRRGIRDRIAALLAPMSDVTLRGGSGQANPASR